MQQRRGAIAGGETATPLGLASWALYEFATGPYFIMVNVFVFSAYFANAVVEDPAKGQEYWGYIQGAAGFLIALSSPLLGALSDAAGPRKPGVLIFTLCGTLAMAALWFAVPGAVLAAAAAVIAAAIFMEYATVLSQAMLPRLVSDARIGFLSGLGFALSYLAACLAITLWQFLPGLGLLPEATAAHARSVGPLAALWCLVFMLPLFLFTPDQPRTGLTLVQSTGQGLRTLIGTLAKLRHYRNIAAFLLARMIYYDGLNAVFIFIGVYAAGVFGWSTEKVSSYAILVILVGALTAIAGGWIDDRLGSKRTILLSVVLFAAGVLGAVSMAPGEAFFVVPIDEAANAAQVPLAGAPLAAMGFTTYTEQLFVLFGLFGGLFSGPAQASSRTLLARLAPPRMAAEFFGLYTLTGRATSWVASTAIAVVTGATGSQRAGFAVIFVFLAVGLVMLLYVREERTEEA